MGGTVPKNVFSFPNSDNFLYHQGNTYNFTNAMTYVSDSLSIAEDPLFENYNNHDFRITSSSPARNFATNGGDAGALPYGSSLVLDDYITGIKHESSKNRYAIPGINSVTDLLKYVRRAQSEFEITVYSLTGRRITSINSKEVMSLKNYSNGLYVIDVKDQSLNKVFKLKLTSF